METGKSRSRVKCGSCGASSFATGWQGNTPGLPDIYVHRRGLGLPVAVALELKAKSGKPTETQKWLADNNLTRIVRTVREAMDTLLEVETMLGNKHQSSRIVSFLEDEWRQIDGQQ